MTATMPNRPESSTAAAPSPTVSAIIPVFNGERFVAEAIASVLAQTRPALECIVVDDGSTDSTADVVARFGAGVRYERQPRSGVSAARNRGAQLAHGDLVGFLDHDDAWRPEKLARQVEALGRDGATMALCAATVIDAAGTERQTARFRATSDLLTGMLTFDGTETVSCSSTGLMRRDDLLAMGGFDATLSTSADWDLLVRVLLEGRITYVDAPLVLYRVHDSNMSRRIQAMEHDMTRAFDKAFAHPALPDDVRRRRALAYGRLYRMLAGSYRQRGEWADAARMLVAAIRRRPAIALELARSRTWRRGRRGGPHRDAIRP